jgi:hypothetical protein
MGRLPPVGVVILPTKDEKNRNGYTNTIFGLIVFLLCSAMPIHQFLTKSIINFLESKEK